MISITWEDLVNDNSFSVDWKLIMESWKLGDIIRCVLSTRGSMRLEVEVTDREKLQPLKDAKTSVLLHLLSGKYDVKIVF